MKIGIITPTLQRASLVKACLSVDCQSFTNWEHIVMVDCAEMNEALIKSIWHPQRTILHCSQPHRNGGNTCRHNALDHVGSDYIIYLDCDNYLADRHVLEDIAHALEKDWPAWAIFPITRLGERFFADPPRANHTDTLNLVLRHDVARWPDTTAYGSDGVLVESLKERGFPYAAFPRSRPIGVLPKISFCKEDE